MNTDWQVGQTVCLMREGEETERRKVAYRIYLLGTDAMAFELEGIHGMQTQYEWQQRGWRLLQEGE